MTQSSSGWATPGAQTAPATHWPPKVPAVSSVMRPAPKAPPGGSAGPAYPARSANMPAVSPIPAVRPSFREPHPSKPASVMAGAGVAVLWFIVTALLGVDLVSTMWVTLVASLIATAAAFLLARYGDRGAAVGITAVAGTALAVVGLVVEWQLLDGTWILW